jgi:hypothetical protein
MSPRAIKLGFAPGERVHRDVETIQTQRENTMNVRYQGQIYEVAHRHYLGWNSGLYGLKSRFSGGATFPARKVDCRPVEPTRNP